MPTSRSTARAVGILMLAAFFLYGVGSSIATTAAPGPLLTLGASLMGLNSLAVIAIGLLLRPILRTGAPRTAVVYLVARVVEGGLLGAGAVALLLGMPDANTLAYNLGMTALGLGSLFFCAALFRLGLVPRFLAVWGFIGYATFAIGCVLELAGVAGAGLPTTIPGGLFELFFAIWMLARGFAPAAKPAVVVAA